LAISSLHIQHFRSLGNVLLDDLSDITVLVGTNAVGKSNVIDSFRFLRDAVVYGLDHAVSTRGGIGLIRQYSPSKPYQIRLRLEIPQTFDFDQKTRVAFYELRIASLEGGNYRIEREDLLWHDEIGQWTTTEDGEGKWEAHGINTVAVTRNADGTIALDDQKTDIKLAEDRMVLGIPSTQLDQHFGRMGDPIYREISGFRFTAIYPSTLRDPARPDTDRQLKENASNWASVLKALRQTTRGKKAFDSIIEMMQVVMPQLLDVTVKGVGGYLVPKFRIKTKKSAHEFDPLQLSDGTLRIFGILLALYQVPPPSFLALEEPEQTVNPGVLSMLADAFKEVSQRTQIFLTSHSPHLIDLFAPEQIRVVSMEEGETVVSRVKKTQVEAVKERLISLSELMSAEGLQPERN
jgi:predicted ATPase